MLEMLFVNYLLQLGNRILFFEQLIIDLLDL